MCVVQGGESGEEKGAAMTTIDRLAQVGVTVALGIYKTSELES
jgi:hypothetical protein